MGGWVVSGKGGTGRRGGMLHADERSSRDRDGYELKNVLSRAVH